MREYIARNEHIASNGELPKMENIASNRELPKMRNVASKIKRKK